MGELPKDVADELERRVAEGVRRGIRESLDDQELTARLWKAGYEELSRHAGDNAARWIGRRILVSFATVAFVVSLTYLVKTGSLK